MRRARDDPGFDGEEHPYPRARPACRGCAWDMSRGKCHNEDTVSCENIDEDVCEYHLDCELENGACITKIDYEDKKILPCKDYNYENDCEEDRNCAFRQKDKVCVDKPSCSDKKLDTPEECNQYNFCKFEDTPTCSCSNGYFNDTLKSKEECPAGCDYDNGICKQRPFS